MKIDNPSYLEIIEKLKRKISENFENNKIEATFDELPYLIGALPSILTGYEVFGDKINSRKDLKQYLEERFEIKDKNSAIEKIRQFVFENAQLQYVQFQGFWNNKPPFQLEDLDEKSRDYFQKCLKFAHQFYPIVKEKGFAAFDFGEGIRMARECYSIGYLNDEEYKFMINDIANRAFRLYDGFEDYAISYLCGGTYFLFYTSGAQMEYANQMFQTLFGGISELFFKGEHLWNTYSWPKAKKYFKNMQDIRKMIEDDRGCLVSDRISMDDCKIGYMVRTKPSEGNPDSGWQFFYGDEEPDYLNDVNHVQVFSLNTICNYDPEIIPLLESPIGSEYLRDEDGKFHLVDDRNK